MTCWLWKVDSAIQVQILDDTVSISHSINTLWKSMNPSIFPPAKDK